MVANKDDLRPVPSLIPEKPANEPEQVDIEDFNCVHIDEQGVCHAHTELHICILFDDQYPEETACHDYEDAGPAIKEAEKEAVVQTTTVPAKDDDDEFDYVKNYAEPKIILEGSKDIWSSGLNENIHQGTECPDCRVPEVLISYPAYLYIRSLAEEIDTEFLAYLNYNDKMDEKVLSRIYIPKQEVSGASVDVDDAEKGKRADAVLHKHPGSLNSFSGVDEHNINANHDISILMTENEPDIENWMAQVRFHTKCGRVLVKKVKVRIYTPKVKVDKSRIKTKVWAGYTGMQYGPSTYVRYYPNREKKSKPDERDDNQQGLDDYGRYVY